jgi:hypothetical protein
MVWASEADLTTMDVTDEVADWSRKALAAFRVPA